MIFVDTLKCAAFPKCKCNSGVNSTWCDLNERSVKMYKDAYVKLRTPHILMHTIQSHSTTKSIERHGFPRSSSRDRRSIR